MKTINVYCDGACSGNGKKWSKGGMGIHFPNKELSDLAVVYKDYYIKPTNQICELASILCTLEYIDKMIGLINVNIVIFSDSNYCVKTFNYWYKSWKRNGWNKKGGYKLSNKNLIIKISEYFENKDYSIKIKKVAGHSNCQGNNIADSLAVMAKKLNYKNIQN